MKRLFLSLVCLMALLTFVGCGGGDSKVSSSSGAIGRASVKLEWPKSTRLVPVSSNSVKITVTKNGTKVAEQTLPRPVLGGTSTANFTDIPVGSVLITATAFPNQDGTGTAQATASTIASIASGENAPVSITMASTVARIDLSSTTNLLPTGSTLQIIATARDVQNNVVLTSATRQAWASTIPAIASVDSNGIVIGISSGIAEIKLTDTESGATASIALTVIGGTIPGGDASLRALGLNANDIIYDRVSQKIYASIPSRAGTNGNTVQIIDPVSGTLGASVFVGSEPNKLALSQDGQYLYVGLEIGRASCRERVCSTV